MRCQTTVTSDRESYLPPGMGAGEEKDQGPIRRRSVVRGHRNGMGSEQEMLWSLATPTRRPDWQQPRVAGRTRGATADCPIHGERVPRVRAPGATRSATRRQTSASPATARKRGLDEL